MKHLIITCCTLFLFAFASAQVTEPVQVAQEADVQTMEVVVAAPAEVQAVETPTVAKREAGWKSITDEGKDPIGSYLTLISVSVVVSALVALFWLIALFGWIMQRSAQRNAAKVTTKQNKPVACDSVSNGEIITAIALAIQLNTDDLHDLESEVITINKVARFYSPWNSKIHGLTQLPERIHNK
ncbi:MAG: OadG family transporter subunit [Alistipes sp.]